METDIRPKYLLVEFHAGKELQEQVHRTKTLSMVQRLYRSGYRLVYWDGWGLRS